MNKRSFSWSLLALVCATILFNGCGDPDKNKLIFKPEVNVARNVNVSDAMTMSMNLMGMEMTIGNTKDTTYIMTPTAIDEVGNVTLEVTYDRIDTEVTGLDGLLGGANMPNVPGLEDPMGVKAMEKALEVMKGETFTLRVSRFGEVLGVEGADSIAAKVADAYDSPAHIPGADMKASLRQGLGDSGTVELMKQIFMKAPDQALNPGDSWQETITRDDLAIPTNITSTITVGGREAGILTLNSVDQYNFDFTKGPLGKAMTSGSASATLSGEGSGTAEYEEATGWPRKFVSTAKASGSMSPAAGISFPMEISAKSEVASYASP